MKRLLLVAAAALAAGCARGEVWYVDGRFTTEEVAELQRGADVWGAAGFPIDLVPGAHVTGLPTDRKEVFKAYDNNIGKLIPQLVDELGEKAARRAEGATGAGRRIAINMSTLHEPLWHVAAHEFGHVLTGSGHASNPYAIMGTAEPMLGCLTRADIDRLCAVQQCAGHMVGCDE